MKKRTSKEQENINHVCKLDKELKEIIEFIKNQIPADLITQTELFSKLLNTEQHKLNVWSSSASTGDGGDSGSIDRPY